MKTIFLDTNIFLHFKSFTEIDWLTICQDNICKIVIAPIVIDELDKYKVGNDEKAKRARKTLQKIEGYVETKTNEIRKNIGLEVIIERPKKSTFKTYHLNPEEKDNHLIASIIEYQKRLRNKDIFLCSNDIGPRLRAQQFKINIFKLSDSYLLPEKDNAIDKQLKALIKENNLLKSRIPKPLLLFENEKDFVKIKISEKEIEKAIFMKGKLIKVKTMYPHMIFAEQNKNYLNPLLPISSLNIVSNDQIEQYNSALDDFYLEYGTYLHSLYEFEVRKNLSFEINFIITNGGNTPAEDVDIFCHFPDGFELIESEDLEDPPVEPKPPAKPKTAFENMAGFSSSFNLRPFFPNMGTPTIPKLNRPSIKKTKSYDVNFFRKYVKHGIIYPLDSLIAVYEHYSDLKNYAIDYRIVAGNIPEPVSGKLNIIYEK
jgi:hypothetical protein